MYIHIYMELVLPIYNMRPYFSLKNLGEKCALYTAKYGAKILLHNKKYIFCWSGKVDTLLIH